jgi:hypothetical protein
LLPCRDYRHVPPRLSPSRLFHEHRSLISTVPCNRNSLQPVTCTASSSTPSRVCPKHPFQ